MVDNGSSDGTLAYLERLPWVRVLRNPTNLGFVKGNNRGILDVAGDRDIILLNNDIEIHQPDWLHAMQESAYRQADVGIVGCRLLNSRGRLQHAGTYILPDTWWGQQIGGGDADVNQFSADREVEGVVFACAYISREVLSRVGLLDEDYFSYFEDTDYCLKARTAGYRTVCCGSVTLTHHEHVSTQANGEPHNEMFGTSQKTFRRKWRSFFARERYAHHLDWRSIVNFPTSYAICSRQLIEALDRAGVELAYRYVYGPGTGFPLLEPEQSDSYLINCVRQRSFSCGCGRRSCLGSATRLTSNTGEGAPGRSFLTMLETDRIPAAWVRQANQMDEVWVPSTFNVHTFQASGVRKPIHVIPLGCDPAYFNPNIQGFRDERFFTFLSVFEWGERKAPEILFQAFADEFAAHEDVLLICKIASNDPPDVIRDQISRMNLRVR